jgi:tRNA A-37 threonylcarbamoyl transferase component Bud32
MSEESTPLEEFPTQRDRAFGDIVVEMGLAARGAVDKTLGLQVSFAFSGKEVPPLPQLLVGQGLITNSQAKRAMAKLAETAGDQPRLRPDSAFTNTSKSLPAMDDVPSLEDGPRIIMPASALKIPDEVDEEQLDEAPPADESPALDKAVDEEYPDSKSTKLPQVPRIVHQPEMPADTGTVEIIMPVMGSEPAEPEPEEEEEEESKEEPDAKAPQPPHPVPATKTNPAEPISGYKLLARISTDETGTIFKAKQVAMDRLVALKVLPPKMTADRTFVDRFLKEARDAGQLNHPNLVRVHEVGHIGNYYFYSMELVQGQSLADNIKQSGRMPPARALQITMEVVKAIDHMNSKDMLHGEISPSAVTITEEGAVKVLLAGLGRSRADSTRFLVGDIYHYVAPERALSDKFDVRADIYSAGALLYYALTGQHPYAGANANQVLDQHFSAPVPNAKDILTDLAADVAKVSTKAMCKNRTERFGGPAEMIKAIEKGLTAVKPRSTRRTNPGTRATRQTTTGAGPVRLKRRRRRRRR